MFDRTRRDRARESNLDAIERDLADLCRQHGVALDLLQESRDIDDLIERVIGDFEAHGGSHSSDIATPGDGDEQARHDLRGLVAFACRASVLRDRAATSAAAARFELIGGVSAPPDSDAARIEKLGDLLATVGVLIHKINNPLTALVGRAQLLRMQGELPPRVVRGAEVIEESSRRIAELTRELASRVKEGRRLAGRDGDGQEIPTPSSEPSR